MNAAGMDTTYDPLTNVYGQIAFSVEGPDAPRIHLGSHYDTVVNAGAFDGILGVLIGIAVVEAIVESKEPFNHNLSVLAFCDEEGVRFNTTFLGSAYLSGQFDKNLGCIKRMNMAKHLASGWWIAQNQLILFSARIRLLMYALKTFAETHIEQGPILESSNKGLGVFTRIICTTSL